MRQMNQGLAETRNNGAKIAKGKYICYLDADDYLDPSYLERTVSVMESDESIGCCYSWVKCFGEYESIWETMDLDPFYLRQANTTPSHSVIRKTAWDAIRKFNGCGFISKYNGYFEDWVFWIDMLQVGYRGVVVKEPLIHYRVHSNSLGARYRANFNEMLFVLHSDREQFFNSSSYRRKIQKTLNKRALIKNRYENYPW
jgi:glycosyltransferase involved in cell wall biosynthesis